MTVKKQPTQLIVRNIAPPVMGKLKRRAARYGRSMEEEVRDILADAVKHEGEPEKGLGTQIADLFKGIELEEPIEKLKINLRIPKFD